MAYVSNNLTHFVGRSLATDELRYELLAKIVRGGMLLTLTHRSPGSNFPSQNEPRSHPISAPLRLFGTGLFLVPERPT